MYQIKFWGRERGSPRKTITKNNRTRLQDEPETSAIRESVAPGILSRFRRLFSSIRGFTDRNNGNADIFSYTPSQNPEEFLANLRTNPEEVDRLKVVDVSSVPPETPKPEGFTRFVCISDTHATHRRMEVPEGDVLLHCGDITERGDLREILDFNDWLGTLPHEHKVVIAGNHDIPFDSTIMEQSKQSPRFRACAHIPETIWRDWQSVMTNCVYLEDSEIMINGIRIYGSPWQPNFGNLAFNLKRGSQILEKWDKIPENVDILLTHGPPAGRLDQMKRTTRAGCVDLLNTVQLRVKPKYHIFGHIHDAYGSESDGKTIYVNCSAINHFRNPVQPAFIFDFPNTVSLSVNNNGECLVTKSDDDDDASVDADPESKVLISEA